MKNKKPNKKPNKLFPFVDKIKQQCIKLIDNHTMKKSDSTMINGIFHFGNRTGIITSKQMTQLGRCYKLYVNNGEFDDHEWWI